MSPWPEGCGGGRQHREGPWELTPCSGISGESRSRQPVNYGVKQLLIKG